MTKAVLNWIVEDLKLITLDDLIVWFLCCVVFVPAALGAVLLFDF